jgi:small subunit ribosomal protein S6
MRRYETIFIVDPDTPDNDRESLTGKVGELISQQGGTLLRVDDWGQRRLAYEIKKKPRGHYILLDYCGTGALIDEMERQFRIDDTILKYMTVLLEKSVDIEAAKEEIAREKAEKERLQKEKAEANLQAANASAKESKADTAPAEKAATQNEPATSPSPSDSPEQKPEIEASSKTEQDSGKKEE